MDFNHIVYGGGISFVGGMSAAGVGIGGGSLYLPVFIALVGNELAIPLAKTNCLAVSAAALLLNIQRKHPKADRPMTNYDIVLLLEPVTLLGTIGGVSLNILMPSGVLRVFLVLLLCLQMVFAVRNGAQQYKEESEAIIREDLEALSRENSKETLSMSRQTSNTSSKGGLSRQTSPGQFAKQTSPGEMSSVGSVGSCEEGSEDGKRKKGKRKSTKRSRLDLQYELFSASNKILAEEKGIPWGRILTIAVIGLTCYALEFSSGGGMAFFCGNLLKRLSLAAAIIGVVCWTMYWCWRLLKQSLNWVALGVTEAQVYGESISWRTSTFALWLSIGLVAGIAAGATGISGGMVKMPFMIQMGISPTTAAATSNFMVLFTSASSAFQYTMLGRLHPSALMFGAFAFVGALLGQFLFLKLQQRSRRQSFVTFWLSVEIGLSIICTAISWYLTTEDTTNWEAHTCTILKDIGFGD